MLQHQTNADATLIACEKQHNKYEFATTINPSQEHMYLLYLSYRGQKEAFQLTG
jgi:hypothetical protein